MTNVEKFRRLLKDIEVLNRDQKQYKKEILEILIKEDARIEKELQDDYTM